MNKKGLIDFTMSTLFMVIVVILGLVISGSLIITANNRYNIAKEYCPEGLITGKGNVNFCKGQPFVCDSTNCYNTSYQPRCWEESRLVGKISTIVTVCD